jgi:hypothetical protein
MNPQQLAILTFYQYYNIIMINNLDDTNFPPLRSITNWNQSPRLHLESINLGNNQLIDRITHFNNNSVRINYFFPPNAVDVLGNIIAQIENENDYILQIGQHHYRCNANETATIECHVRFNQGNGQPDPESPTVEVLDLGVELNELEIGTEQAFELSGAIVDRMARMIRDIEPLFEL